MPPHILRRVIEDRIEALISELDDIDGDWDVEPNGDEQDASFPEGWRTVSGSHEEDAEDDDPGENNGDCEPSLGSVQQYAGNPFSVSYEPLSLMGWGRGYERRDDSGSQIAWASGATSDAEGDEHDGREPDEEGEPWLGWTFDETRSGRYAPVWGDCEGGDILDEPHDAIDEDTGIGDAGGLAEVTGWAE